MAQRVRMHLFFDARSLRGMTAGLPNHFRGNRLIAAMVPVAWKQPHAWLALEPVPVLAELVEQLWAQQDIAIFAALATLDMNDHALAVDVGDFQARESARRSPVA